MNTKQQANELKAVLESMLLGENFTKRQIEYLKEKVERLIETIDEELISDDDFDSELTVEEKSTYTYNDVSDDLPF